MSSNQIRQEMRNYVRTAFQENRLTSSISVKGQIFSFDNRNYTTGLKSIREQIIEKYCYENAQMEKIREVFKQPNLAKGKSLEFYFIVDWYIHQDYQKLKQTCIQDWGKYKNLKKEYAKEKNAEMKSAKSAIIKYFQKTDNIREFALIN